MYFVLFRKTKTKYTKKKVLLYSSKGPVPLTVRETDLCTTVASFPRPGEGSSVTDLSPGSTRRYSEGTLVVKVSTLIKRSPVTSSFGYFIKINKFGLNFLPFYSVEKETSPTVKGLFQTS